MVGGTKGEHARPLMSSIRELTSVLNIAKSRSDNESAELPN